ncbi:hypothetical protein OEG84_21865 [Hoeflea sp. G2-23]|uniref:Uncharacterized protein n=1 Tax=Hoeflea algicola TaxID=2983763 RepID=A0ABT3ZF09_9HYPH|nr:hypothetical protein [Hoeflea algicola]MCY0150278.1 hypothetical protein [Hoeflea algicola]
MANRERDTTIVTTSSGGAGWFVAVLLLIVLALGGYYLYSTGVLGGGSDVNISIDVPKDVVPDATAN